MTAIMRPVACSHRFLPPAYLSLPSLVRSERPKSHSYGNFGLGVEFVPGDRSGIYTCVIPNKRRCNVTEKSPIKPGARRVARRRYKRAEVSWVWPVLAILVKVSRVRYKAIWRFGAI